MPDASEPAPWTEEGRANLLDAETTVTQTSGGLVRVEKAGLVGVGRTAHEAAMDLGEKMARTMTKPEPDRDPA